MVDKQRNQDRRAGQRQGQGAKNQTRGQNNKREGDLSVREAGKRGGQRVRELVEEGKESEGNKTI